MDHVAHLGFLFYCQAQAKFQLQLAWVISIITVPVIRAEPTQANPARIVSKVDRNGLAWLAVKQLIS